MSMFDMMGKARELQTRMQEVQQSLATKYVTAISADGRISVEATGARRVSSIHMDPSLFSESNPAALQRSLRETVNAALEKADELAASEMKEKTSGLIPNIPGLNIPGFGK